ncbi:ABC transporter permease subunit [Lichenibacterium ramalinae]|uniref:ABC transporter permease subunit n=1 Tax=Lichenibacterium ramalinae TaxID=2316527 RepID=A0A4Q2R6C1_9HYPH|nr:ABC transporter permease subunit [Lichenibacterium ramalinae]RYB01912.1 ABC transporter permease subunit [Lichenibacterium ramalinae]
MTASLTIWRDALPALLDGLELSLAVTGVSLLAGLPLGLVLALGLGARDLALRWAALAVAGAGRGAPVLILLQAAGLGLPAAGMPLSPFAAASLALGWAACAGAGTVIRAGLDAVPADQREAAAAMGLPFGDVLRFVLLPQGLRLAVPGLIGVALLLFQASSLAVAVGLPELTGRALQGAGRAEGAGVPVLLLAALLYAAVSIPALLAIARLERRRRRPAA